MTKLCKDFGFGELKGSNTLNFEKPDDNDTILYESGQRRHRQLLGRFLWLDRPDIKNAVCQCWLVCVRVGVGNVCVCGLGMVCVGVVLCVWVGLGCVCVGWAGLGVCVWVGLV